MMNAGRSDFEQLLARSASEAPTALVRRLCDQLLDEAGDAAEPPVQVARIASHRDIGEIWTIEMDVSGQLWSEDGRLIVAVNALESQARRRFSVLHEVGHTLLPGFATLPKFRCDSAPSSFVERMASFAAAELLMPRRTFIQDLENFGFGLDALQDISGLYWASMEAVALRAVDLATEPRLLLVYALPSVLGAVNAGSSFPVELNLRLVRRNGAWPSAPSRLVVGRDSALGRAWRREPVDGLATLEGPDSFSRGARASVRRYGDRLFVLFGRPGW
jgi:hypothetical protein